MFVIRWVSPRALREKPEPVCLLSEIKTPFSRYEGVGGRLLIGFSYLSVLFCRKGHLTAAGFLPLVKGHAVTSHTFSRSNEQGGSAFQTRRNIFAWFASPRNIASEVAVLGE